MIHLAHASFEKPACFSFRSFCLPRNNRGATKRTPHTTHILLTLLTLRPLANPPPPLSLSSPPQIDASGRVIDLDANASRLHIIEKEFVFAERQAFNRLGEEEEMRRRVQLKRHQALDKARREEKLVRMKEDRTIRRDIVQATREAMGLVQKETKQITKGK